jgi:predicted RNA-binding Zn-ribbon protein involved in translation (DUF1610 family)
MDSVNYICPNCKGNISIRDVNDIEIPKLKSWRERRVYSSKKRHLNIRQKDCFICPHCKEELIIFLGKLYKSSEVDKEFYNTVYCDNCGKGVDIKNIHLDAKVFSWGDRYLCFDCLKRHWFKWALWSIIIFLIFFILIILVFY